MRNLISPAVPSAPPLSAVGYGRAHAKAILFGEHAVVYGASAIAIPVPGLRAEARATRIASGVEIENDIFVGPIEHAPTSLDPVAAATRAALASIGHTGGVRVSITCTIPYERGLGSSAAVAIAIAESVVNLYGPELTPESRHEIAQAAEHIAHGRASGLDASAVVANGPIKFHAGTVSPLRIGAPFTFVIADSGVSGSTAEAVAGVRALRDANPAGILTAIEELTHLADQAAHDLAAGAVTRIGTAMSRAHELLIDLGVSTPDLDALVDAAHAAGAIGAKLTGGGLGGCIIALAESPDHAHDLAAALSAAGARRAWVTTQRIV